MTRRSALGAGTLTSLVLLAAGCSDIPTGDGDPALDPAITSIASSGAPTFGTLAVARVDSFSLAMDESEKGWSLSGSEAFSKTTVRDQLVNAFRGTKCFTEVEKSGDDSLVEAWEKKHDLVAFVAIENLRTVDDGRNGWWIPNMFNWFFWMAPSWWGATSMYSLELEGVLAVKSGDSFRDVFPPVRFKVKDVQGTFDEFDRGWPYLGLGVFYCNLDGNGWKTVALKLWPALRRKFAVQSAVELKKALGEAQASKESAEARKKTLVLSVGLSRYEDPNRLPPLPFAASDAKTLTEALVADGVAPQHLVALADSDATAAAFREELQRHLTRAREGDTVILYFAGYGTRTANGAPVLLFHDADLAAGTGEIGLDELAKLLQPVVGQKLLVLDTAFSGRERSVKGGAAPADGNDLGALDQVPGLVTIVAGGPLDAALAPEYLGSGLLTYHCVEVLKSTPRGGRIAATDLFERVRPKVVAEAALLGEHQSPRAAGLAQPFTFEVKVR
jgi:hypothetical protein